MNMFAMAAAGMTEVAITMAALALQQGARYVTNASFVPVHPRESLSRIPVRIRNAAHARIDELHPQLQEQEQSDDGSNESDEGVAWELLDVGEVDGTEFDDEFGAVQVEVVVQRVGEEGEIAISEKQENNKQHTHEQESNNKKEFFM